jgi:hypothetical protein
MVEGETRAPIYGPIYEAHDFTQLASGCGCNLPIFKH